MKKLTSAEFDKAIRSSGLVVVDFYADWCAPCRALEPILEKLSKEYDEVKFYKVDVMENPDLPARFFVSALPFLLFFLNGLPVHAVSGLIPEDDLRDLIESFL